MALRDPREIIAEYFQDGDSSGPAGTIRGAGRHKKEDEPTQWFIVFRPTSDDSIGQMKGGMQTGKGLNIKGKSSKKGRLSGMVPFLQINKNEHRAEISTSPPHARVTLYFRSDEAREQAYKSLSETMTSMVDEFKSAEADLKALEDGSKIFEHTDKDNIYLRLMNGMDEPEIRKVDDYAPESFGLDLPEKLLVHAYIKTQDITLPPGWETGRGSEPHFMDMNLHALRDASEPVIVLLQADEEDPMNPRGLVMAYSEAEIKAVVSDFDPFLIGSRGMSYAPIKEKDFEIMKWCLEGTQEILAEGSHAWNSSWLKIMKKAHANGFHPKLPKYGFGDKTTTDLIHHLVTGTSGCGAVRHGAECFNWYFPQELDEEYLVVWNGFALEMQAQEEADSSRGYPDSIQSFMERLRESFTCCSSRDLEGKPKGKSLHWQYYSEAQLRSFLLDRVAAGYSFPLNPAWTVRDKGWYEILTALRNSEDAKGPMESWYPKASGILEFIDSIHQMYPDGVQPPSNGKSTLELPKEDEDPQAAADAAQLELRRHVIFKRGKARFRASAVLLAAKAKAAKRKSVASAEPAIL